MFEHHMRLTGEQQAVLDGGKGETLSKVMETLIRYGELFGAEKMVPVTSEYNHLVTSFGLKAMGAVYELMDTLIGAGALSGRSFPSIPSRLIRTCRQILFRTSCSTISCTPSRNATRRSFATWGCCPTARSPAPVTWTRSVTFPRRGTC